MTENVENLIVAQLREICADMGEMRPEIADVHREIGAIRQDITHVDSKVNGVSLLLTMPAGHVHGLETRVEALETRRD